MNRSHAVILLLPLGALAAWASCAVYDTSLLLAGDAGADVAQDGGPEAAACVRAAYPERPAADDDGGVVLPDIVLAIQRFDFAPNGDAGVLRGFDLDQRCTCPGPSSCVPLKNSPTFCDDDAGRDNSGAQLLDTFTKVASAFAPQKLNQKLQNGEFGLIVRVRNYNGTANDTSVDTALFLSNGTASATDGGAPIVPKFDGNDFWTIDPRSLLGGVAPPYIPQPNTTDTAAYVKNGVLVASLATADLEFNAGTGLGSLRIGMTGVVVTGKLVPTGTGSYRVDDGLLAGRWPSQKFLTSLAPIHDPITQDYLCGDASTYGSLKLVICKGLDITSFPQNDNTNAPCDALSIALGFAASPANFGAVKAGVPPTQPCGAQWTDECR